MDSTGNQAIRTAGKTSFADQALHFAYRWLPLLLLVLATVYGLLLAHLSPLSSSAITKQPLLEPAEGTPSEHILMEYTLQPMNQVLPPLGNNPAHWEATAAHRSAIGYIQGPTTFRFAINNPDPQPKDQLLVVSAPFLDHLAPAMISPEGVLSMLPVMGDIHPFRNRLYDLPQWIWPVTLAPGTTTFYFEVRNSGPTMLPVSLQEPKAIVSGKAFSLAWKAFVTGLLTFALLFNIVIVVMLRRPGLGWLSILMVGVIHSQLVIEGFGLWFLWPDWPQVNALLNISLPLCLIALCQFTPHFMAISKAATRVLHGLSLAALVHLVGAPLGISILGQGSFLLLTAIGGTFLLMLVLGQVGQHVYARYYACSLLVMLCGALVTSLRTVGWIPVNSFTDSAFFLGAAAGSLILTSGIGRLLLEERRKRLSADVKARQEHQLRSQIERDYDRLLKTHRVTGKPNRAMLEESLNALDTERHPYTLCLVRLERFNEIEQALGYRTAEELLKSYLRRLNSYLKRVAGSRLVIINGFAIASVDTINHAFAFYRSGDPDNDQKLMDHIGKWLSANFREGRFSFSWSPSVGIAHAPEHGVDAAGILSSAGVASLNAEKMLSVYDPTIAEWQYRQQILMLDVEQALAEKQMWLEYQAKVNVRDTRVTSFEALIRWQHPEFGKVPPDHWIPLAEKVGMIHPVTLWVVEQACKDHRTLANRYGEDIGVAVNISAKDLAHRSFETELLDITSRHGMAPGDLILEITETSMMADPESARAMIDTLSRQGFRIALDDFGTGHSSLSTLASFALDELKIDRSFLSDILNHPTRQRIFRAALELGEALDLEVVVEGVEDEAVACWLQQFPGLHGQGYYWGRPTRLES